MAVRHMSYSNYSLTCALVLCRSHAQALCDLEDVSEKEKLLFLLWNKFMRTNPILSQNLLPSQLRTFVKEHAAIILESNLEEELIAHMTNMWCEGVIGRENKLECMRFYNAFVAQSRTSTERERVTRSSRSNHRKRFPRNAEV